MLFSHLHITKGKYVSRKMEKAYHEICVRLYINYGSGTHSYLTGENICSTKYFEGIF